MRLLKCMQGMSTRVQVPPPPELRICKPSLEHDGGKAGGAALIWQCFDVLVDRSSGNVGIMVDDATSIITQVVPKSAGDRAGLAPFDRVVAVDGRPLNGARLANTSLTRKRRAPSLLRIERPPRTAWPALAHTLRAADERSWLAACLSFAHGDIDGMVAAVRKLPGARSRRLSVDDASALALLSLARSGSPLQLRAGMLLFDVALECGHGDLVQHLLLPMLTRDRASSGGLQQHARHSGATSRSLPRSESGRSLPRSESVETLLSEDGTCTESDYGLGDDKSEFYDQSSYMDGEEESQESEA